MPDTDQPTTVSPGFTVDVHTPDATAERWAVSFNGDCTATLNGPRPQLIAALRAGLDELVTYCTAEHENALHFGQPEPGCPMCAQEQVDTPTELADLDAQIAAAEASRDRNIADGRTAAAARNCDQLDQLVQQRMELDGDSSR
jgi:hypothetical protein